MVIFTIFFTLGVWLLQQQSAMPDFVWAWLLLGLPIPLFIGAKSSSFTPSISSPTGSSKFAKTVRELARSGRQFWLKLVRFLLTVALACGLGFYYAAWQAQQRLSISLADEWQGRDIEVIGVVAGLPRNHERGLRFVFEIEQTLTPHANVPSHVYLGTYFDKKSPTLTLHAGERWQLTLRLKQPHGSSNPHGFDFELWALENNIRAVGYVYNKGNNVRLDARADGMFYRIETWREIVRDKFSATLGHAQYAGVLSALAIGDQSSIPQSQWQIFTRTGVNHLMSISGLHITMLASFGFALTYWLWRRSIRLTLWLPARKAAALIALLVALGYALLSGFGVPAQRTVYMVGAVAAALWLNRNFSLTQILSIALLGVLIPDPWAVLSPGFWLSFGAVALILYVTAHRIGRTYSQRNSGGAGGYTTAHSLRVLSDYLTVQWAMTIGLIPLLLGLFQQVSLVSPFANAFAIPLVSLAVVPLALLGAALPWDVPLWLAHIVMDWTMQLLTWLNALPQAVWTQHAPPVWSVVIGMLGVLLILAPRGFPARWLGFIWMLPMFLNTPEPPAANSLRLVIFDVGQGLAVAAQTQHHALLYDTGPDFSGDADSGNRILIPTLRALGIAKLDGLILTHDDIDHTGGAVSVMQAMPIDWVTSSLPNKHLLLANLTNSHHCQTGESWQWDGVNFEMLNPDASSYIDDRMRDNNRGCVLRISIASQHILLTADIEKEAERQLLAKHADKLSATLLVVPHHGSKSSSTGEFIAATLPDYAVFTVGYRNRFGHPKEEIVQHYADSGAELLRSDEDGAILVEMNQQNFKVERYRKTHLRYWTHLTKSQANMP
jgi:competence protein ComEC